MDSYKLSDVEQKQLNVLKQNMDDIRGIVEGKDCVEGELVFWADTEDEALLIANGYGASLKSYKYGIAVIELPEEVSIVEALELATSQTDEVVLAAAWPNYYRMAYDNDTLNLYDDPFLDKKNNNYQWQHDVTGSRNAWNMGYTGKGIKIAVLDSGCTNHGDIDILESYSCVTDNSVEDTSGHGTHVTGTIAAKFNNNKGGAGIAPQASICNIKVLENIDGKCVGTDAQVMAGIAKAIEVKADIINMSLGGDYYNAGYEKLTQKAYNKGIAIFAAAGNDASSSWSYPAECKYVYSVGSIRQDLERSEISNYGDWVEYSAPGEDILSTYETAYARMSGTSQATAVISGTAAVILSAREDIRNKTGKAKVDALLETMNKGKISGGNEASTIVSLTKALNLTTAFDKPKAPKFSVKSGTKVFGNSLALTIEKANATDTIYFSTDGKSITYKNGVVSSNAQKYVGEIVIGNAEKVTVKAIAINPFGVAGPISTATYRFAPSINEIMINGQSVLLKGRNTKLKTTILPSYAANKKVKWSITPANQGVTVSNGTVKASKSAVEGEYIVKVEAVDGGGVTGTHIIYIKENASIKSLKFQKSKDTITRQNDSVQYDLRDKLSIILIGGQTGSVEDVTWSSNNNKVATVKGGIVTLNAAGTAKITAMAADGSGKKATFTLIGKQLATGINIKGYSKVAVGKSIKLTADILPVNTANKKVKWKIEPANQGVTISNGKVKASSKAKTGNYTITAVSLDGSELTATKYIEVTDNVVTRLALSSTEITLFRTEGTYSSPTSTRLEAYITSNKGNVDVEYTSSNPGVATVTKDGVNAIIEVTGTVTGTTKITCKTLDGSGKSAVCMVKVVNAPSKLMVTPKSGYTTNVAVGYKTKLKATFNDDNGKLADTKVKWESSNTKVATVNAKGEVKAIASGGTAIITATAVDGSNAKASCKVSTWSAYKEMIAVMGYGESGKLNTPDTIGNYKVGGEKIFGLMFDGDFNSDKKDKVCQSFTVQISDPKIATAYTYKNAWGDVYFKIIPNTKGKTTITIKSLDGSNKSIAYTINVK